MAGTGCRYRVGIADCPTGSCDDAVIGKLWRMDVLINLLPWLAPPILGAVIGYVTNRIAIQMLFRPRAEKRILGFHVPFTPGIIPRNRNELAESIARAVAGELISREAVRARLNNPELKVGLEAWIRAQRRSLMESRLDTPGADVQELLADLMPTMAEGLHRMLRQPAVRAAMVEVGTDMVRDTVANRGVVARTAISAMLNVERLVTVQVKTLDVVEVERMIRDVAGHHLRWINYFGAGLGALIGLAQVALRLLGGE